MQPGVTVYPDRMTAQLEVNECYDLGMFRLSFAGDGSINCLLDANGKKWADDEHRLGTYRYETFAKENYDRYFTEYVTNLKQNHECRDADFSKPGMEYAEPKPEHKQYSATVRSLRLERKADCDVVLAELKLPSYACNRKLHGVGSGLYYDGSDGRSVIETLDAPLVCSGERLLLQFDNTSAPLDGGFHFNLHNNVWGTNFMMWFEDDMKYRFRLTLQPNRTR